MRIVSKNGLYFYLYIFLLIGVVLLGSYVYFNLDFSTYKYVVERKGVSFVSNTDQPADVLERLRASDNVLLAVDFVPSGAQNAYSTSVVTLFTTVFVSKGHKVTLLARVLDEKGNLVSCSSNFGDPKRNEEISLEECSLMFSDRSLPSLYVPFPKKDFSRPLVVLSGSRVEVFSHSFDSLPFVSFVVAEAIYPDASSLIEKANVLAGRL